MEVDEKVMARLRAPFGCELITGANGQRWRIHDANDDVIATVSGSEEGYARLIVGALNGNFKGSRREARVTVNGSVLVEGQVAALRVAVTRWLAELTSPAAIDVANRRELGPLADAYETRLREVEAKLVAGYLGEAARVR